MKDSTDVKTEISSGARVRATIRGSEDLIVRGRVEGAIELDGELTIAPGGVVKANVTAMRVLISGILVGDVKAAERIEITAEGRVVGDLTSPALRVAEGARFSGGLSIGDGAAARPKSTITPREDEWRSEVPPEPPPEHIPERPILRPEEKRTMVTSFAPPKSPSDDRRRKRVVVKKRR